MMLSALDRGRDYLLFHAASLNENYLHILDTQYYKRHKQSILSLITEDDSDKYENLFNTCNLNYVDKQGNTLLFTAPSRYLPLLTRSINIDARNNAGETALHYAAKNGNINRVTLLLQLGADKSIKDYRRKTPRQHAKWNNFDEIANILGD